MPGQTEGGEMASSTSATKQLPSDRSMLYCPQCGYESRINDDWLIHVLADSLSYSCPNCKAEIPARIKNLIEKSGE
jgi:DNA-directed RNA polymerase subunit RPC12/RpoP